MNVTIHPSKLAGIVKVPASKSHFIRTLAAAMLAKGTSKITNPSACDDAKAMLAIVEQTGATIKPDGNLLEITGTGEIPVDKTFGCGESALVARLMLALAALSSGKNNIEGTGTLLHRDLGDFEPVLEQLGAKCISSSGKVPVTIKGPIAGGKIEVDGTKSSQFISGLLMALPLALKKSDVKIIHPKSKPYLDLTLNTLNTFGIRILNVNHNRFIINPDQKYTPAEVEIEGDWSSAAFLFVAGAIAGDVRISGLNPLSLQADRAVISALEKSGAQVIQKGAGYAISKSELKNFRFDATDSPDLFPPLVVLAAYCKGTSVIKGVNRLANKESNRAAALKDEFGKLGIEIVIFEDEMRIKGGAVLGGEFSSRNDHRIAMAGAIAALGAKGPVIIQNAKCITKSWPAFYDSLKRLGTKIDVENP